MALTPVRAQTMTSFRITAGSRSAVIQATNETVARSVGASKFRVQRREVNVTPHSGRSAGSSASASSGGSPAA